MELTKTNQKTAVPLIMLLLCCILQHLKIIHENSKKQMGRLYWCLINFFKLSFILFTDFYRWHMLMLKWMNMCSFHFVSISVKFNAVYLPIWDDVVALSWFAMDYYWIFTIISYKHFEEIKKTANIVMNNIDFIDSNSNVYITCLEENRK